MDTSTALAFVLPTELFLTVNEIRSQYDKAHYRWMPHINFVFPFVRPEKFEECQLQLQGVSFPAPFLMQFEGIGYFAQKSGYTFHLKPSSETSQHLGEVFRVILTTLPEVERSMAKNRKDAFHPHLTLAQCSKGQFAEMKSKLEDWFQNSFQPAVASINAEAMQFHKVSFLHRSPETLDKMEAVTTVDFSVHT